MTAILLGIAIAVVILGIYRWGGDAIDVVRGMFRKPEPEVVPVVEPPPTVYTPVGDGCKGEHDPVPVIPGEHSDDLLETAEPVGYLCSRCLASVTAEGKFVGDGMMIANRIDGSMLHTGTATGTRRIITAGGHALEVTTDTDGKWGWQFGTTAGTVLVQSQTPFGSFEECAEDLRRVMHLEVDEHEVHAFGSEEPVRRSLTLTASKPIRWGDADTFNANVRAMRREQQWGDLIEFDPENLARLEVEEKRVSDEALAISNAHPVGQMPHDAKVELRALLEDGLWLRQAIATERRRHAARTRAPSQIKAVREAEQLADAAMGWEPSWDHVETLTDAHSRLARTMQVFLNSLPPGQTWLDDEQQAAFQRMQAAIERLNAAIEFHRHRHVQPAPLSLEEPQFDYFERSKHRR